MLEIQNIKVKYNKAYVIKDLSISIDTTKANILGILGKNGAGKTTLFRTIFGMIDFSGTILWKNKKLKREDIAYLETTNYFYPYIKGKEYLNYFESGSSLGLQDYRSLFNLPLDEYVDTYSTGMKKKLALIGVLLLDKPIIILDEPFNGLDYEGVHILYDIINELKLKQKVVLMSSHIIETLYRTCDNIAIIQDGTFTSIIEKNNFGSADL